MYTSIFKSRSRRQSQQQRNKRRFNLACESLEGRQLLTVSPAPQTLSIGTVSDILTYGTTLGSAMNPATVQDASGHAVVGTFDFVENGSNGSSTDVTDTVLDAGSYDLSVTFNPTDTTDYSSVTTTASITITPAKIAIVADSPANITYGVSSPILTNTLYTDLGPDPNIPGQDDYQELDSTALASVAYTNALGGAPAATTDATLSAGDHTINPTDISTLSPTTASIEFLNDFDVVYAPGTLTVDPAVVNYTIGIDGQTYGSPANLATDLGTTIAGVNGETLGITYSSTGDTATANVGTYAITGVVSDGTGLASNYTVNLTPGTLTVNQAVVNYPIGIDSQTYGSPANLATDLGTTIAGVNGETLGITYSSTGDTATANVGTYAITGVVSDGTGLASNYDVTLTPGVLTVNPATITIGNDTQTYGSPANLATDLGTTIAGVNGETLGITYSSTGDTATANVGTYAITGVVSDGTGLASNYTVNSTPGTLTVDPAVVNYTIGIDSQTYGSPANLATDLGTTIAGVNGETLGITYSSTGDTATANVGTYAITGVVSDGTGLASNYTVNLTPGTLTVDPAVVNYTIGIDGQTYGSPANLATDLGTTIAGVNGETLGITYSSTGDTATANVGTYAITGVVSDGTGLASNYTVNLTPGTLTVDPAVVNYTIGIDGQTYGSPANLATDLGTTIAGVNGETLGITYSSTGDTATANVGTYAITGVVSDGTGLASNYTVNLTPGTLTVDPAVVNYTIGIDSQTYGSPANLATDLGTTIAGVNGETLGITYSSTGDTATANVGTYAITGVVSDGTGLASNYTVNLTLGALTVDPAVVNYTIGIDSQTYGSPANLATDLGTTIAGVNGETLGITYSSTGDAATANVGTYAITGVVSDGTGLASNYTVNLTPGTLTVDPAVVNYTIGIDGQTYGSPANLATDLGTTIAGVNGETLGITYSSTGDAATANVGTYAITGVVSDGTGLASNYTVNLTPGTLTVDPAVVNYTIGIDSQTYGSPANLATDLGTTIAGVNGETLGITYSSTGDAATANVGTYAITGVVSDGTGLASNYTVNLTPGTLTVNPAVVNYTIGIDSQTYGSPANLATDLGTTIAGVNGETLGITYSSTGDAATANVGTYAITGVVSDGTGLASNYTVNLTPGTLTVNQAVVNYTIGIDGQTYGSPANLATDLGTTIAGVNGETLGITYSSTGDAATANVGTYAITGVVSDGTGLASNYTVNLTPGTLTVNPAVVNYTIGIDGQTYGSPANLATDLGTTIAGVNGETLGITYSSTGDTATANVGTYAITGVVGTGGTGLASNYTVNLTPGVLTVNPATITIGNDSQTYGSPANLAADLGTTIAGVNGETLGITYSSTGDTATANVGTYAITGVLSGGTASNYLVTGTLTVNPATITIGNDTQTYGSPANLATDLGTTIAGVNGETLGITYSSTGDMATANVGTYAITGVLGTGGTGLASNYIVTNGTLTVTPATLIVTANNTTMVLGGPVPTFSAYYVGLVNGDSVSSLGNLNLIFADGSTTVSGTSTITLSGNATSTDSDYTIVYDPGTLTVNAATEPIIIGLPPSKKLS